GSSWSTIATPPPSAPPTANIRTPLPGLPEVSDSDLQGHSTHLIRAPGPSSSQGIITRPTDQRAPGPLTGTGTLFPALIVGLGQMGLTVLQRLREDLGETAPLEQLTNLRFLLVDTDPEVMRQSSQNRPDAGLSANEVL